MRSRLTAAFLTVALFGVGVAPCAGWQSSAEARRDCCVKGQCPGEIEAANHSSNHRENVPQAAADQCCATSEQQNHQRSAQFASVTFVGSPPLEPLALMIDDISPPERIDPDARPHISPHARLHLLFSVYLL